MSGDVLEEMLEEVERLRLTLEAGDLDAERATEVLERVTQLAQDALTEIERRAEQLGPREPAP